MMNNNSKILKKKKQPNHKKVIKKTFSVSIDQLNNLSLGPSWASNVNKKKINSQKKESSSYKRTSKKQSYLKEKSLINRKNFSKNRKFEKNRNFLRNSRSKFYFNSKFNENKNFVFYEIFFHPNEDFLKFLINRMKKSMKSYKLFEIAEFFLNDPKRFFVLIKKIPNRSIYQERNNYRIKNLYTSLLSKKSVFSSKKEAMNYSLRKIIKKNFNEKKVKILNSIKGNFQIVHQCPITKKIIGAPNFHLYKNLLITHYNSHIYKVLSFKKFLTILEPVREEKIIQKWIKSIKNTTKYILNKSFDDTIIKKELLKTEFENLIDLQRYLSTNLEEDNLIKKIDNFKIQGEKFFRDIKKPKNDKNNIFIQGEIKKAIKNEFKKQKNFPLITADNIRIRLRKFNFQFYKLGTKNITYVCKIKKKFIDPNIKFSNSIQKLIEFINKNQNISIKKLLDQYKVDNKKDKDIPIFKKNVLRDLFWLISEGYLICYSNNILFLMPSFLKKKSKIK
jgi:hypothetical protein